MAEQVSFLQQKRFSDKFTFIIRIPEEAEDILIHKMLLQPIIENCVVHGINEMKKDGKITVEATMEEGNRLRFVIKDNGKGIGETTLARLNRKDSKGISARIMYGQDWRAITGEMRSYVTIVQRRQEQW